MQHYAPCSMMIYPSINKLMEKMDSRYTLVVQTAKRARQLASGDAPLVDAPSSKSVTTAVNEIYQDKVTYMPPSAIIG